MKMQRIWHHFPHHVPLCPPGGPTGQGGGTSHTLALPLTLTYFTFSVLFPSNAQRETFLTRT